jgi:hypothetical protein
MPPGPLTLSGMENAFSNGLTVFPGALLLRKKFFRSKPGYRHMEIHPVENGPGKTLGITATFRRGAATGNLGIPVIAADTGIGGTDQKHPGGIGDTSGSPVYRNAPVLQRLPHGLQKLPPEFGHFIEKKHPPMGQADLSRLHSGASVTFNNK